MPSLLLFLLCVINIMTNKNEKKAQFSRFLVKIIICHVCTHVCACLGLGVYKREQQFSLSHGWMTIKVLARRASYMNEVA